MTSEDEIDEYQKKLKYALETKQRVRIRYYEEGALNRRNPPLKKVDGEVAQIQDSQVCINDGAIEVCMLYFEIVGIDLF